jgi:hypothetical protein
MWGALLNFCGWAVFCLAILPYVREVCLELAHFSGQDQEACGPDALPSVRVPHLFSLGWPA